MTLLSQTRIPHFFTLYTFFCKLGDAVCSYQVFAWKCHCQKFKRPLQSGLTKLRGRPRYGPVFWRKAPFLFPSSGCVTMCIHSTGTTFTSSRALSIRGLVSDAAVCTTKALNSNSSVLGSNTVLKTYASNSDTGLNPNPSVLGSNTVSLKVELYVFLTSAINQLHAPAT